MNYLWHILTMIGLYAILGLSLNLAMGYGGMLSVCHAAFYGIGAYTAALLMLNCHWSFLPSLVVAVLVAGGLAWLIAVPAIRFHGDFFVLVTLGFQIIVFSLLHNWVDLTGGPYGIPGIPRPALLGFKITTPMSFLVLTLVMAGAVLFVIWRLTQSPYGRTLQAVRDDETAAQSLGKNVIRFKRRAFTIAGMLAAVAGVLYASYTSYIDPTSFNLDEAVFILAVVVIGGAGNMRGPVLGAIVLVLLPEILRFVRVPDAVASNMRQVIYGLLLVLMMRFRPQGIAGKYAFD